MASLRHFGHTTALARHKKVGLELTRYATYTMIAGLERDMWRKVSRQTRHP